MKKEIIRKMVEKWAKKVKKSDAFILPEKYWRDTWDYTQPIKKSGGE